MLHGIAAKDLGAIYAISVGNDDYGTRTWYQSPLGYAYNAQTQTSSDKAIMLALFDYCLAAQAYMTN